MKKLLLMALAISMTACSTDDAAPLTQPQQINEPVEEAPDYRMFIVDNNFPLEYVVIKTKRGDDDWIERQFINESITLKENDSIWVSTGNYYVPDDIITIGFQVNDRFETENNWNTNFHLQGLNEPINIKWAMELFDYD